MAKVSARTIEVLSPVAERRRRDVALAPRPSALAGKVLGLLDNGKPNADVLVATVAQLIVAEHRLAGVVRYSKSASALGAGGPLPRDVRDRLITQCDVVLNAIGD